MIPFEDLVRLISQVVELSGIGVTVIGIAYSSFRYLTQLRRHDPELDSYRIYRRGVGRSILLGLEFLVAADIIRTVTASASFASVGILAAIVLIRTFLSMTLELEIDGRLPWQEVASTAPSERPRTPDA